MSIFLPAKQYEPSTEQERLRRAVLLSFQDGPSSHLSQLLRLSARQWYALLQWLDTSGLALYLYDRLEYLKLIDCLPAEIADRLRQNLADNSQRTNSMFAEAVQIQELFRQENLEYLLLKGFSLVPFSVARPELRSQLDLDFLITADAIDKARRILEDRGYVVHAVSGRSWEFKTTHPHAGSLRDLYKDRPARNIELHVEARPGEVGTRVADGEWRIVCGYEMPVLPATQLFLGQVNHLYKHVSTGFFRCSHLLELYRHIAARHDDAEFWSDVNKVVQCNERLVLPLGVTTSLLTQVMGEFAPQALVQYVDRLSTPVLLWTEKIGPRCAYATWPGNKLHLLLQREITAENIAKRASLPQALLPRKLPPPIAHPPENEKLAARAQRYWQQLAYILFRLRYHIVTGVQYAWELVRWRRLKKHYAGQQNVTTSYSHGTSASADIAVTNK